jgi:thiosulfate dehydrogenase
VAHGGRIYDKWWKEIGASEPAADQPLWTLQATNARSGADTWRCKECHGWDYKGKGGAYSSGSHFTGFTGVLEAAATMNREQLIDVMKGATDFRHDFTEVLGDEHIGHVVDFLQFGLINTAPHVDYTAAGMPLIGADADHGKPHFETVCALCHGSDGRQILIDGTLGVGDVARDEPTVEIIHKIRSGQPGTAMPSAVVNGWSIQHVIDVLAYIKTLP